MGSPLDHVHPCPHKVSWKWVCNFLSNHVENQRDGQDNTGENITSLAGVKINVLIQIFKRKVTDTQTKKLNLHTHSEGACWLIVCALQGILSPLILGGDVLTDWKIYPLDIDGAVAAGWPHSDRQHSFPVLQKEPSVGPTFYMGTLQPNGLAWDSFLRLSEWTKVNAEYSYCGTVTTQWTIF